MTIRAFITGAAGVQLTTDERAFLRDADPWGLILFARNVESPDQVSRLVAGFREAVGRGDAPVLIDQEGGRVQRLGPPHWPSYPAGAAYGRLYHDDRSVGLAAARLGARLIAADLDALGITVDCMPIADVLGPGADPVIGDRAFGTTTDQVSAIATAFAAGLADGGVLQVLKHIPGHGRAAADSHHRLPVVTTDRGTLEATDFAAFRFLAGLPLAMTAHVVFSAIDSTAPATTSATMVREVIRGSIGFDGLLMSDDLAMNALSGTMAQRARAVIAAGCDMVLHCNGRLAEMQAIAAVVPSLSGRAAARASAALASRRSPTDIDVAAARDEFASLLMEHRVAGIGRHDG
ncbi:MAG TPA: beta-N-acetylhexosaminidase [Xanthobacteraceae bacterium]|nr:beta-N-acetylhexosaminidase [Xanthobacteraceae bacterium]